MISSEVYWDVTPAKAGVHAQVPKIRDFEEANG
jgi:hypothetical protein